MAHPLSVADSGGIFPILGCLSLARHPNASESSHVSPVIVARRVPTREISAARRAIASVRERIPSAQRAIALRH